jgi:histidinol-phosphate aminotransferase
MANGSDELLNNLIRAFVDAGEEVAFVHPSYSYYATLAEIQGAKVRTFGLNSDYLIADFPERYAGKIFFLTSPNAPLGFAFENSYIAELAQRCAGMLVVDEAYVDFTDLNALALVKKYPNVVVTRTFSKSYALAGMRLGLAVARPEVIAALDKIRDHYHLDRLALVAASAALLDQDYLQLTVAWVRNVRDFFSNGLRKLGYQVIPSHGNYVFASPPEGDAKRVYDALFERKILVRYFSDPWLKHGLRISIGTREEMLRLLSALAEIG